MKKNLILFIALIPFLALGQEKENRISSSINQVTVFLNQAQINRTAKAKLKSGNNTLIFEELPTQINPQSIQVSGKGNFTILSVSFQINYLKTQEKNNEVKKLETSLTSLNKNIKIKEALREVITAEETMLKANQTVSGSQTGLKVAELREATEFYRLRLTDIKTRMVNANAEIDSLKKESKQLENQLSNLRAVASAPTGEIIVNTTAPAEMQANLELSYLVFNAGWIPTYDIRAKDINSLISLTCKANVFQNTGEDWNNVMLTLSTGNPTQSGSKPELNPWWLDYNYPRPVSQSQSQSFMNSVPLKEKSRKVEEVSDEKMVMMDGYFAAEAAPASAADFAYQHDAMTSTEFSVDIPYDIPSGEKQHTVEYKKHELPASYIYYAVRKLDKDAFLMARIANWNNLNLLSGETNLFFEGTYVGKSYLDVRKMSDTLELSLGRDKGIIITRVKGKDLLSKQLLGSSQKETRNWDIAVRNTKKQAINIVVEDQIPVSTNKEIEVEAVEISQAQLQKETGKLTWNLNLQPGESKAMKLQYNVKYPKGKTIILE